MIQKYRLLNKIFTYLGWVLTIIFIILLFLEPTIINNFFYFPPLIPIIYTGLVISFLLLFLSSRVRCVDYQYNEMTINVVSGFLHNYLFVNGRQIIKSLSILKRASKDIVTEVDSNKIFIDFRAYRHHTGISCYVNDTLLKANKNNQKYKKQP